MRDERRPNHEKLETLEVLRENVNWEIVEERHRLIEKLFPYEGAQLIQFVARSGYKHQPQFDEHGKPLLNRITPIH
ncbi:hypothetical protein TKK_0008444 [Trichogramma kaykai]